MRDARQVIGKIKLHSQSRVRTSAEAEQ